MAKILFVEDDKSLALSIQDHLELDKHRVEHVENGEDALAYLDVNTYDLIILDVGLPGISGVEVCNKFRNRGGKTPILMLTANNTLQDKESGFSAGVDDYLTKPFHIKELLLRLKALLRRPTELISDNLTAGALTLDRAKYAAILHGNTIRLSPTEYALLEFLMRHPGRTFSQDELLEKVWSSASERTADTIRTCIRKLRAKIDLPGKPSIIENLHGIGYRLMP